MIEDVVAQNISVCMRIFANTVRYKVQKIKEFCLVGVGLDLGIWCVPQNLLIMRMCHSFMSLSLSLNIDHVFESIDI